MHVRCYLILLIAKTLSRSLVNSGDFPSCSLVNVIFFDWTLKFPDSSLLNFLEEKCGKSTLYSRGEFKQFMGR